MLLMVPLLVSCQSIILLMKKAYLLFANTNWQTWQIYLGTNRSGRTKNSSEHGEDSSKSRLAMALGSVDGGVSLMCAYAV